MRDQVDGNHQRDGRATGKGATVAPHPPESGEGAQVGRHLDGTRQGEGDQEPVPEQQWRFGPEHGPSLGFHAAYVTRVARMISEGLFGLPPPRRSVPSCPSAAMEATTSEDVASMRPKIVAPALPSNVVESSHTRKN